MTLELRTKKNPRKWSTRKARLFAVACCRWIWYLLDDPADRRAVEAAEDVADGRRRLTDLRAIHEAAGVIDLGPALTPRRPGQQWDYTTSPGWDYCYRVWINPQRRWVCRVARWASTPKPWGSPEETANDARVLVSFRADLDAAEAEQSAQCDLLRDIVGPTARPVLQDAWLRKGGTVRGVAEAIYEDRAFERLPVLADALEDAGCTDEALLGHLRGPGLHARGCWALDLVLSKE